MVIQNNAKCGDGCILNPGVELHHDSSIGNYCLIYTNSVVRSLTMVGDRVWIGETMETDKLVSIIMPVFNVATYLSEALNSVLNQTYDNLEIIIVDDGSTDGSSEICDEYAGIDNRILVIHQENKGLSSARNIGLDVMTGDVVAFLDSDDALQPNYVDVMITAMSYSGADIVICKYSNHRTDKEMALNGEEVILPALGKGVYNRADALRSLSDETINMGVWNKLYSRSLWSNIRFPEDHVYEDIDTTYRVINLCTKICVMDQPLYMHRMRTGSIIDTSSRKNIDDYILACSHFESFVKDNIPDIYDENLLRTTRQKKLNRLIGFYVRYSQNGSYDKKYCNNLREQIVEIGNDVDIGTTRLRRKILYSIICRCPWLLRISYPVYRFVVQQ